MTRELSPPDSGAISSEEELSPPDSGAISSEKELSPLDSGAISSEEDLSHASEEARNHLDSRGIAPERYWGAFDSEVKIGRLKGPGINVWAEATSQIDAETPTDDTTAMLMINSRNRIALSPALGQFPPLVN